MRRTAPEAAITIRQTNRVPPFAATPNSEVLALALRLAEANETFAVSYATEAGLFQDAGAPSIVCGPGDIAQAHTANEWIARSEIGEVQRVFAPVGGLGGGVMNGPDFDSDRSQS